MCILYLKYLEGQPSKVWHGVMTCVKVRASGALASGIPKVGILLPLKLCSRHGAGVGGFTPPVPSSKKNLYRRRIGVAKLLQVLPHLRRPKQTMQSSHL